MTLNVLSLYKKTWPGNKFGVSFLHDSIHCEHCLKGKIHIVPPIKNKSKIKGYDPPGVEDLSKSCFYQSHLKSFPEIKHDSIPESSFLSLGVKLTKSVAAKLNQECDSKKNIESPLQNKCCRRRIFKSVKSVCKTNKSDKKKLKKCSKTENKEPVCRDLCGLKVKEPLLKENDVKKPSKLIKVKEPTKGTLKRKRWTLQKLKQSNLNYEDDLFEDQKFCNFTTIIEDDTDSEKYEEMRTPQISLSPVRDGSSTPTCNDCYSPGELFSNRKEAEEYIFRREKRRKLKLQDEKSGSEPSPEKPLITEDYTLDLLKKTRKMLKTVALKAENCEKESDEDDYFTDVSDCSD